jgi:hypothetical protein
VPFHLGRGEGRGARHEMMMAGQTNLALNVAALIFTVGGSSQRRAGLVSSRNATTLCEVLLSLCSAAAELVGLEGALGLEGGAAMFGDVLVSHGCGDLS